MDTGKILGGLILGAAAGAILGILFAPDKGTNTRKKLSKSGEDLVDDLKSKIDDFIEKTMDNFNNIKEDAEVVAEKSKHQAYEAGKEIKKIMIS